MSENENETKDNKKPLFNHPKENYQIFEEAIIQSEQTIRLFTVEKKSGS